MSRTIDSFKDSYRFLSNFWPAEVVYEGVTYPSVEHAYQAAKTLDLEVRKKFETVTAAQAKSMSKKLVIRPDWEEIKLPVMENLLRQKFAQGSNLRTSLNFTKGFSLIEGNNWHDNFWGTCFCKRNGVCSAIEGKNHLGRLLMTIRDEEKEEM